MLEIRKCSFLIIIFFSFSNVLNMHSKGPLRILNMHLHLTSEFSGDREYRLYLSLGQRNRHCVRSGIQPLSAAVLEFGCASFLRQNTVPVLGLYQVNSDLNALLFFHQQTSHLFLGSWLTSLFTVPPLSLTVSEPSSPCSCIFPSESALLLSESQLP